MPAEKLRIDEDAVALHAEQYFAHGQLELR